jgi:predicted ATPase
MELAIQSIDLRNLLSFGPDGICPDEPDGVLTLQSLNIIIGPNGVGKSNLIDSISLLQAAARGIVAEAVDESGGVGEWIWKGPTSNGKASIEVVTPYGKGNIRQGSQSLRYHLTFAAQDSDEDDKQRSLAIQEEYLKNAQPGIELAGDDDVFSYLEFNATGRNMGRLRVSYWIEEEIKNGRQNRRRIWVPSTESLRESALPKVSSACPEATFVRSHFDSFRLYREWGVGRNSPVRLPQEISSAGDYAVLREDARNIPALLNKLPLTESRQVRDYLRKFYGDDAERYHVEADERSLSLLLEEHDFRTPTRRMSDGTLRWFALMAVLLHCTPPSLICLEEPEIGLHPDMIPVLARLLKDASQHTQIIVTTHSDILVDSFTDEPESVIVCEKQDGATKMKRLAQKEVSDSLKDYSLAELWSTGQIGGNRV